MTGASASAAGRDWALLRRADVRLVAIDLRGTLLRTPRVTALLPELASQGVPEEAARSAQARFDVELRGPLQKRGDVLDWTRFAASSMASTITAGCGATVDVDAVVAGFRDRYLSESRRLVEPGALQDLVAALPARCVVVADGPLQRESAVLASCFEGAWEAPVISSQCLGVNKLTHEFFVRLAARWNVPPASAVVIGDRWDKDVAIPERAGCRGVLVGGEAARSLADLAFLLNQRSLRCAA